MPKNNQMNKGKAQGTAKGLTTVSPGQTGKPSEEYATELGGGTTGGYAGAGGAGGYTGAGGGASRANQAGTAGSQVTGGYNEYAGELGGATGGGLAGGGTTGGAGTAGQGMAGITGKGRNATKNKQRQ